MNYGIVVKVLGSLLIFKGLMLLPAILVSFLYREAQVSAFLYTVILTLLIGIPCTRMEHSSERLKQKKPWLSLQEDGW